ncbi:MAG: aspartate carbamoyltransferase catalytic subunit [Phycisphaerales bacterium]|jgi:aspartate carbamoyltransferase catalytic subunit
MPPHPNSLLDLRSLDAGVIRGLLIRAREMREPDAAVEPTLAGHTVATLFFENSTRTRVSFTIAAQRLGGSVVDLAASASSVAKGESLADTARTIEAMGVSAMVVRAAQSGAVGVIARAVKCPVINAGDGQHEHPTQALADALTIADSFESAHDFDLAGLRVGIVGDVLHSRVARSNAHGLTKLGAHVTLVGPEPMAPDRLARGLPITLSRDLDAVLGTLDVVMMLRIQLERGAGALLASPAQFRAGFGLTADRAATLKPGALIMHPGPMNRGVEIDDAVADGLVGPGRPVIWDQVANGVVVRMAALEACIGPIASPAGVSAASTRATVTS